MKKSVNKIIGFFINSLVCFTVLTGALYMAHLVSGAAAGVAEAHQEARRKIDDNIILKTMWADNNQEAKTHE